MIIESGIIIFLGLLGLAVKLPLLIKLRALGYPIALDIAATGGAYFLHRGSMTGVLAAAVAGLMCSSFISICRALFGYIKGNKYYPGWINLSKPIKNAYAKKNQ